MSVRPAAPFYLHPAAAPREWAALVAGDLDLAFAVVNAHNGPGAVFDPHYYGPALAGGCRTPLVGYVDLTWGRREITEVLTDVAAWREWYGVTDVMLDCTPAEPADVHRVRATVAAVRAAGAERMVLNPGREVDPAIAACGDVVCTAETDWPTYRTLDLGGATWSRPAAGGGEPVGGTGTTARWHLVHGVPAADADAAHALVEERGADLAWVTDGELPDPWSTLPTWYFSR